MKPLTPTQLTLRAFLLSLDAALQPGKTHMVKVADQTAGTTLRFNLNRLLAKVGQEGAEAASCHQRQALIPLVGKFHFSLEPAPEGEAGWCMITKLKSDLVSPKTKLLDSLAGMQLQPKAAPPQERYETFAQSALGQVAMPSSISGRLSNLLGEDVEVPEALSPTERKTSYYKR